MREQLDLIRVILDHKKRLYNLPQGSYNWFKKTQFDMLSYSGWAVDELLDYVYKRKPLDVMASVEEFRTTMDLFACEATTEKATEIFLYAEDVATNILDELLILGCGEQDGQRKI